MLRVTDSGFTLVRMKVGYNRDQRAPAGHSNKFSIVLIISIGYADEINAHARGDDAGSDCLCG